MKPPKLTCVAAVLMLLLSMGFTATGQQNAPWESKLCKEHMGSCGILVLPQSFNESYSRFAMALGGGLDGSLGHGISLRPVQAEYLMLREPQTSFENGEITYTGFNHNTFRYSTGVTFRFGQRVGTSK